MPILVDDAGREGVKTGDHCWEREHLFYLFNKAFPSKIHSHHEDIFFLSSQF